MRARGIFGGFGLLAGLGAFWWSAPPASAAAPPPKPILRAGRHCKQRTNNPRGTTPNRSLRRIQGRQRAMRFGA